jgi:hypothetical protein
MLPSLRCTLTVACLALLSTAPRAQWTEDAATNTAVSTAASDQSQPKLVPAEGGGVWVSWFDGIGSGYDVRVQRIGMDGEELLPPGGVLVADRSFSSTQDYGLARAADGGALLAYRQDVPGGVYVAASRVDPDGTVAWTRQCTGIAAFVASPVIAGTDDGSVVVAWTQDSFVAYRRLDADGNLVGGSLPITTPGATTSVSDMHAAGDDVILSFVDQTGGFGSPRRLYAQKIAPDNSFVWGAGHVQVFTSGSLQFGNFPDFAPDGSGGAVLSWYDTGSFQLQCYVQHLLTDGTTAFAAGGVPVSTDVTRVRVSPWATHDATTGETFVTWVEQTSSQSQDGVYAQKLDAAGTRLWTDEGAVIVPVGTDDLTSPLNVRLDGQTLVVWDRSVAFGQDQVRGALLDGSGAVVGSVFDVATSVSGKSRLAVSATEVGDAALVWADDRDDGGDIYAQNVNADGTLGPRWLNLGGGTVGVDGVPLLTCSGALSAGSGLGVSLTHAQPGGLALLWVSFASTPANFFGGTIHALPVGFELLVVNDADGAFSVSTPFPAGVIPGSELAFQFLCQDDGAPFNKTLTDGIQGTTP